MSMSQEREERLKVARLGFIGAGSMGGALLQGLLSAGWIKRARVLVLFFLLPINGWPLGCVPNQQQA